MVSGSGQTSASDVSFVVGTAVCDRWLEIKIIFEVAFRYRYHDLASNSLLSLQPATSDLSFELLNKQTMDELYSLARQQ